MRISVLVSLTGAGLVAATTPGNGCNGNNCFNAVNKESSMVARKTDCQSFLLGTYTTTPVTTKTYYEAYCGGLHGAGGCPGGPTAAPVDPSITTWPTAYPDYLTYGDGRGKCTTVPLDTAPANTVAASSSAYASACSCAYGVTASVTTVVAPTFTACVNKPADKFKLKRKYQGWPHDTYKEVQAGTKFTFENSGSKFLLAGEKTSIWKDLYTCDGNSEIKVRAKDGKLSTTGQDEGMTCKRDSNGPSNWDDLECKTDGKTEWKYELGSNPWLNQLVLVSQGSGWNTYNGFTLYIDN